MSYQDNEFIQLGSKFDPEENVIVDFDVHTGECTRKFQQNLVWGHGSELPR